MSTHLMHGARVQIKDTKIIGLAVAEHLADRYTVLVENSHANVTGVDGYDLDYYNDPDTLEVYSTPYYTPEDPEGMHAPYGEHTVGIVNSDDGGIVAYVHEDYAGEVITALRIARRHA